MRKSLLILILIIPIMMYSQDPREFNHGTCIIEYLDNDNATKYYLTWSSSFNDSWQHDIYKSIIYFDNNGNLVTETPNQTYIGTGLDEAQEPVNATINATNNYTLSVWEDGNGTNAPNVRGQLHQLDGTIIRPNWVIAGDIGSQHSANTSHLNNKFLVFYADEAPPSTGGAVLKAKVIDDITGNETQSINLSPNNEDHWWPVSVSNSNNTRTLIVWGNDGYAARGTVLYQDSAGIVQQTSPPQDYLLDTQQYYYQVEWLENISKFILIARNGAYNDITDESKICLIDTSGNITNSAIVNGGILREAKMAVKWSEFDQSYSIFYPSGTNNLTQVYIDNSGVISSTANQIIGHSDLSEIQWTSTGIWSTFINDTAGNDLFDNQHIALFVINDILSNNIIKIPVKLDTSLFNNSLSVSDNKLDNTIIYPNPTSEKISVPIKFMNANYEIYALNGQHLQKGVILTNSIDLSFLSTGVYFIKITAQGFKKQQIFKIIKEK